MRLIDSISKNYMAPLLKSNGFKKKSAVWNRARGNFIDIIELDELRGSSDGNERFVINIGICIPMFSEVLWGKPLNGLARDADALIRLRLDDFLTPSASSSLRNGWIDLAPENLSSTGREIAQIIEIDVLTYLSAITDFQSFELAFINSNSRHKNYPLAKILYALLRRENAQVADAKAILESIASGSNKVWALKAKRVLSHI